MSVRVVRADPDGKWLVCAPTQPFDVTALLNGGAAVSPSSPLPAAGSPPPSVFEVNVSLAPNGVNFEIGMQSLSYIESVPSHRWQS